MDVDVRLATGETPALRLDLGDLGGVRVRARTGLHKSFQLLVWRTYTALTTGAAIGNDDAGTALRRLSPGTVAALGLLVDHCPGVVLNSVVPPLWDVADIDEYLSYLRSVPAAVVAAEVEATFPDRLPGAWQQALDHPERWWADVIDAVTALSEPLAPALHRGRVLVDREIDRLGSAVVRDVLDGFLTGLGPKFAYHRQSVYFGANRPAMSGSLAGRVLSLAPHVGGQQQWAVEAHDPHEVAIAYPVPGFVALGRPGPVAGTEGGAPGALTQLLGRRRAMILQTAARPVAMSELAALLDCTPAAATYHCGHLVGAGLLMRVRRGQFVLVERTERGRDLVAVLH